MLRKIWIVLGAVILVSIGSALAVDSDGDGIEDAIDNCPSVFNPQQQDTDGDGIGNDCDACLLDAQNDVDGDGRCANVDNCPTTANVGQEDADGDGIGDACDNCPTILGSSDYDLDDVQQCEDNCPRAFNPEQGDEDGDEVGDICDACPADADNDIDGDSVCGDVDNCPAVANGTQDDGDGDLIGDACDTCPADADNDIDGDSVCGGVDNCPAIANGTQDDGDRDLIGDACDTCPADADNDIDGDTVCGDVDNCPAVANADQADENNDGWGDLCELTVCSSGCEFTSIQAAVDAANDGELIVLGAETFYANVVVPDAKDLTIRGTGRTDTVVDGGATDAVFHSGNSALRLENMTIRNGGNGGVLGHRLTIENCLVTDNSWPGGISGGGVVITRSVISDNRRSGVTVNGFRSASIHESTIANNGVGVYLVDSSASIANSTIADNQYGGIQAWALSDYIQVAITNTTISGNSGGYFGGGGLDVVQVYDVSGWDWYYGFADVTITQSTIAGNSPLGVSFSGYYFDGEYVEGWFPPSSSSFANVFASNDCAGLGYGYYGGNIADEFSSYTCYADYLLTGFDPVLRDNGGPTKTHALLPGSSAIDAGGDDCPTTDQRGVERPQDGDGDGVAKCDIGAYEVDVLTVASDIKPEDFPNSLNPYARGVIPVAILGSDAFDVAEVNVATLRFGPSEATPTHSHPEHLQDVNYDGIMDLMLHFRTRDTGIACGDESATLTGETLDGRPIEGSDSIVTVGCRETRWPAIWMKDQDRPDSDWRDGPVNIERE